MNFAVASVRENKTGQRSSSFGFTADGFSMTNVSLTRLVMFAFRLKSSKFISGLPGWADSVRFDIAAKMDEDQVATLKKLPIAEAMEDRYIMLQQMIFERFNFKIHHVQKEFPAYALVVEKGGAKLQEPNGQNNQHSSTRDGDLFLKASPLNILAASLSNYLDREVVDQTGLTGRYDISLKWAPRASLDQPDTATVDYGPSIFTAVREQLGLRLVSTHPTEADTIIVDGIEMPSEN
jgi:uncharacterized protein (TIGR03435 family)